MTFEIYIKTFEIINCKVFLFYNVIKIENEPNSKGNELYTAPFHRF